MSGSPKNIQRDGTWTVPKTSLDEAFAAEVALNLTLYKTSGPAAVAVDQASVQSQANILTVITIANRRSLGIFMTAPEGDNVPFRIKAGAHAPGLDIHEVNFAIVIGYGPASITGSNDIIEDVYYLPFRDTFDDLVMVPALVSGDTYFGRALSISIAAQAGAAVNNHIAAYLSVQNLGVKPPTMQNAVS